MSLSRFIFIVIFFAVSCNKKKSIESNLINSSKNPSIINQEQNNIQQNENEILVKKIIPIPPQTTSVNEKRTINFGIENNNKKSKCVEIVEGSSTDETVVAKKNILISGFTPSCQIELMPNEDKLGMTTIGLSFVDKDESAGSDVQNVTFTFEVLGNPDSQSANLPGPKPESDHQVPLNSKSPEIFKREITPYPKNGQAPGFFNKEITPYPKNAGPPAAFPK